MIKIKSAIKNYDVNFVNKPSLKKSPSFFYVVDNFFHKKNFKFLKSKKNNIIYIKSSEQNKSYDAISSIILRLLKKKINRSSTIVCIGGGTTQDICSFISFILFRGINWIFLPTTLLSQADSCIGSKIAINLRYTKNVLGGYWPPNKVYIDESFLKTLSKTQINSGFGEMAHYFYLSDQKDFIYFKNIVDKLKKNKSFKYKEIIKRSLLIKKKYIEKDEFENGERIFLNYGHTFAHAIEAVSNFKIAHGIAVSLGMHIANYISFRLGYINKKNLQEYQMILEKIFFTQRKYRYNSKSLLTKILQDKKTLNNKIKVILIKKIGSPFIKEFSSQKDLLNLLNDYLKYRKSNDLRNNANL